MNNVYETFNVEQIHNKLADLFSENEEVLTEETVLNHQGPFNIGNWNITITDTQSKIPIQKKEKKSLDPRTGMEIGVSSDDGKKSSAGIMRILKRTIQLTHITSGEVVVYTSTQTPRSLSYKVMSERQTERLSEREAIASLKQKLQTDDKTTSSLLSILDDTENASMSKPKPVGTTNMLSSFEARLNAIEEALNDPDMQVDDLEDIESEISSIITDIETIPDDTIKDLIQEKIKEIKDLFSNAEETVLTEE